MTNQFSSKPAKLVIDGQERTITYDNRAEFRMGSLDRPFSVADLRARRRSWAALVAWVWACLSESDAVDFPSPEALAPHLRRDDAVDLASKAFIETYLSAIPPNSKKAEG